MELFGEIKKLMGHVIWAYFVDFKQLFTDWFVTIDIFWFHSVLPNILNSLDVKNQSI